MKLTNEYAQLIPHYDDIPKTVLGAIAYSLALHLEEDDFDRARRVLITEWAILHNAGIVPQAVPANLHSMVAWDVFQPDENQYPGRGYGGEK